MAASYLSLATRMPPSDGIDVMEQQVNVNIKQEALQYKVNFFILIHKYLTTDGERKIDFNLTFADISLPNGLREVQLKL